MNAKSLISYKKDSLDQKLESHYNSKILYVVANVFSFYL